MIISQSRYDLREKAVYSLPSGPFKSIYHLPFEYTLTKLQLRLPLKHQHMRRAAHLEPANALPLGNTITLAHCSNAAGDFNHAHCDQGHPPQSRIACIDDEDVAGGSTGEEGLGVIIVVGLIELKAWILQEICSGNEVRVFDDPTDGSVPLVVAPRIQVPLVDSPPDEAVVYYRL
jgi:hypothetical protein